MRFTKWSDRIGETKQVNGIVITLVKVLDGNKIEVEVKGSTHTTTRDTWRRGKFSRILRGLRVSKYVGQTKVINNILFTVKEYAKGKVEVVAEGFDGAKTMTTQTWNNGKFFKNIMKVLHKVIKQVIYGLIIHPEWRRFNEAQAINTDEECINSGKFNSLNLATSTSELKKEYYKLCKIYHPDCGGSQEDFENLQFCYEEAYRSLRAYESIMEELGL